VADVLEKAQRLENEPQTSGDEKRPTPVPTAPPLRTKKPNQGITIVDTSAALQKDAPSNSKDDVVVVVPTTTTRKEKSPPTEAKGTPQFKLPSLDMLVPAPANIGPLFDEAKLRANAELLVKTLADYKITGKVEEILPGPVVTTFEVSPVAGTKVS